jgi:hypothetical protein
MPADAQLETDVMAQPGTRSMKLLVDGASASFDAPYDTLTRAVKEVGKSS